ncbi:MAG: tetratricopeptide repeat protein [Methanospirillaceae archaeon]|nr:tetratricopeptide repeat protein [Methanospirillaceae archaeon]
MKKNQELCNALYCCVFLIFVVFVTGSIHPSDARQDTANQDSSDILTVMMPGEPGMTDTTGVIGEGENEFTSLHHEVSLYQNALLFDPTSDLMLNNLGLAYKHLGEYEKAEEAFIEAISLNSTCKEAWNNLGDLFCTTGRYHDAVSAYNESLRIDNTFAGAYNGKGYALKNIGELQEALDACTRAVMLDSTYGTAWKNRGDILFALSQYREAYRSYKTATRYIPDNCLLWNNMGHLLMTMGDTKGAIQSFQKACLVDPPCQPAQKALRSLLLETNTIPGDPGKPER